jgi:short subunit dehydrogenase-like uncharacterized protein
MKKPFDLILYGAIGFVGQQAMACLAQHADAGTRLAIAGRSQAKLEAALDAVARTHAGVRKIHIHVADAQDEKALSKLATLTRMVRRSLGLRGREVVYQEYLRFGRSLAAGVVAASFGIGSKVGMGLMAISPMRKAAQKLIAQPGESPSAASMVRGFFKIELVGESAQGNKLRAVIGDSLDAGNGATLKMMCESALALTEDEARLPKAAGVITPSVALGDVLEKRLLAAGMRVEMSDLKVRL